MTAPRGWRPRLGWRPWASTVVRLILGGIFVAAGAIKVVDPLTSIRAVRAYQLLPDGWVRVVGWGLPFGEIALGLLLIAGLCTRWAALLAAALLVVFLIAVVSAAARGLSIDCGCFGGGGQVAGGQTAYPLEVARDLGFLLLAGWLIWQPQSRLGLQSAQ